jgi:hypothetical protein
LTRWLQQQICGALVLFANDQEFHQYQHNLHLHLYPLLLINVVQFCFYMYKKMYTSWRFSWNLHNIIYYLKSLLTHKNTVNVKNIFTSHIDKKIFLTFSLTSLSLYIFTIWKCIAYNRFCRDGIYFDKKFWLSLCKIARSSVILLLPLFHTINHF